MPRWPKPGDFRAIFSCKIWHKFSNKTFWLPEMSRCHTLTWYISAPRFFVGSSWSWSYIKNQLKIQGDKQRSRTKIKHDLWLPKECTTSTRALASNGKFCSPFLSRLLIIGSHIPLGSIKTHSHLNPIFSSLKSSKNKKFMSFGKPLKFPAICAQPRPCSTNTLEIRAVWRHLSIFCREPSSRKLVIHCLCLLPLNIASF